MYALEEEKIELRLQTVGSWLNDYTSIIQKPIVSNSKITANTLTIQVDIHATVYFFIEE